MISSTWGIRKYLIQLAIVNKNKMVTPRTVNLRNIWYYKKSSNTLKVGTYSKKFLIQ